MVPVSLGAADVVVVAGGGRFAAHAALLAAHSGYLRQALAGRTGPEPLYVPNVSAQQFWPLLAYMYTGYLDLTADNIYQVLLAAHLLHMPRALELCRSFLAAGRPLPPTLVKPIPSRKPPPFFPPSPFRPIFAENPIRFRSAFDAAGPFPSTSEADPPPPEEPAPISERASVASSRSSTSGRISVGIDVANKRPVPSASNKESESVEKGARGDDKIVVDVACCDGPVRFHRVLNAAYKSGDRPDDVAELTDSDDSYVEIEEDTRSVPLDGRDAFNKSLQKQMNENIRTMNRENNPDAEEGEGSEGSSRRQPEAVFTCVYCNHTFKSQYCYQKHARRHLNPVSIDAVTEPPDAKKKASVAKPTPSVGPRREVRLLDMNVQYYPCKTCGSKFPSYYFVHKHRKLCHAEEMEGSSESGKSAPGPEKKRMISATTSKSPEETNERDDAKPAEDS